MKNPFESMPRKIEEKIAITDSIESNEGLDDKGEEDALYWLHEGMIPSLGNTLFRYRINPQNWARENRREVLDVGLQLVLSGQFDFYDDLVKLTGVEIDWHAESVVGSLDDHEKGLFESRKIATLLDLRYYRGKEAKLTQEEYGILKLGIVDPDIDLRLMQDEEDHDRSWLDDFYDKMRDLDNWMPKGAIEPKGIKEAWEKRLFQILQDRPGSFGDYCVMADYRIDRDDPKTIEKVQRIYEQILEDHDLERLRSAISATEVPPDFEGRMKESVKKLVVSFVGGGRTQGLYDVEHLLGHKLDFSEPDVFEAIQAWYKRTIGVMGHKEMFERTGIKPDFSRFIPELEGEYKLLMRVKRVDSIKGLFFESGIKPDFEKLGPDLYILVGYALARGRVEDVEWLEEWSGIKFDCRSEEVLEGIRNNFFTSRSDQSMFEFMERVGLKFESDISNEGFWEKRTFHITLPGIHEGIKRLKDRGLYTDKVKSDAIKGFELAIERMLEEHDYKKALVFAREFGIPVKNESLAKTFLGGLAKGEDYSEIDDLLRQSGYVAEITPESLKNFKNKDPRCLVQLLQYLPRQKNERRRVLDEISRLPGILPAVPELSRMVGLAKKKEHCPWENEFKPLLEHLDRERDLSVPVVRDAMVEFVRLFGMKNLPLLARTMIDLESAREKKENGTLEDWREVLPGETRTALDLLCAKSGFVMDGGKVEGVDRVKQLMLEVAERLKLVVLRDELPDDLEHSPLEMELFNSLFKKTGKYGNVSDREDLISRWRRTMHSSVAHKLPNYYPDSENIPTYSIGNYRGKLELSMSESEGRDADEHRKAEAILRAEIERQAENKPMREFLQPFIEAVEVERSHTATPELMMGRLGAELRAQCNMIAAQIEKTEAGSKKREGLELKLKKIGNWRDKAERLASDEGAVAILEESLGASVNGAERDKLIELLKSSEQQPDDYLETQLFLEALQQAMGDDVWRVAGREARVLMMRLMRLESPGHFEAIVRAQEASQGKITPEIREAWTSLMEEELLEHFVMPDQAHNEIRKVPFTTKTLQFMEALWRVNNIKTGLRTVNGDKPEKAPKHPLLDVARTVRELQKKIESIGNGEAQVQGKIPVSFYGCHGLGRIFAGDVASACYDKQRLLLAAGEFPNLHAVLMAHEDKEKRETVLLGSFLLIHGRDISGKSYVAIRALNPTERAAQDLDVGDFLDGALDYAQKLAQKGGLDQALLCVDDHSRGHGTNRDNMFSEMEKRAQEEEWLFADQLQDVPETYFNDYDISDTEEERVYRVWSKSEAEEG